MKILFLGDFYYDVEKKHEDIKQIVRCIRKKQLNCILNLEGTLEKTDTLNNKKRGPRLACSKNTIEILKEMNTIGVCLANNHMMDYSEKGLEKTIRVLKESNIKYCGAGKNIKEAKTPMNIDKDVFICDYGWEIEETQYATENKAGCSPRREKDIINQIKGLRKNSKAKIIVQLHWGFEYNLYPMPLDRKLAYKIIDAGADIIIGHHPHVIQAFESYKGKPIYYSLGNFYFGSRREIFNNKIFNCENRKDRCNYGMGLIYNSISNKIEKELVFYYESDTKSTKILEDINIMEVMPEITNIDKDSLEYKKIANEGNHNVTPILTGEYLQDYYRLTKLKTYYFLKKVKKKILKK